MSGHERRVTTQAGVGERRVTTRAGVGERRHWGLAAAVLSLAAAVALALRVQAPLADARLLAALLLAWVGLQLVLHEALAVAIARGPARHREALDAFAQRLAGGHFDALAAPVPGRWRDPDLLALRAELRELHEERARVQRLLAALRASETDRMRRDALDTLRQAADGDERWADGVLGLTAPPPPRRRPSWPRLAAAAGLLGAAWLLAGAGWA